MPRECRPDRVAGFVVHFLAAFTAGDREAVARSLASSGFVYSVDGPEGIFVDPASDEPTRLLFDYLDRRHEQRERLRLVELAVANTEETSDSGGLMRVAGVSFLLLRTADDFSPSARRYDGKANIRCAHGAIVNWQMVPERRFTCLTAVSPKRPSASRRPRVPLKAGWLSPKLLAGAPTALQRRR